ncbi:MAG: MFS transporter [bacterium]|nr:MFS transporter [bacterium]
MKGVSSRYSNYVLGLLFVVYVFNFIDRQVLSILLPSIKADLDVSDTYMGFLTGPAFVLFYTFAGIPIARFADRTSRRSVIALGLVVWTAMTAASGLVRSFWQLAAARVGVGIGEAAGSPPAHSLLSDYFPPERRATALSIYGAGVYLGVAVAYLAGGYIGHHFGWRTVYLVIGMAGFPLAALVRFSIRELPRGYSDAAAVPERDETVSLWQVLSVLRRNRSFVLVVLATSVMSLSGYGVLTWGATFLMRVHGMGMVEVGVWLGLAIGITGGLGAYLGGRWADALGRRDRRWYVWLPACELAIAVPFVAGFVLLESRIAALLCFIPFHLLASMYLGPMLSTIQNLVVPHMRATASAVNLFVVNLVGLGIGPLLMGFLNDLLAADYGETSIRWSMLFVGIVGGGSSILFYLAGRSLRDDLDAAQRAAGQEA